MANVFAQFAQPVKSVQQYNDERDAREVNRLALQEKRRANALAEAATAQQTSDRTALQRAAQESGGDPNKLVQLLRSSGSAGLMTQADALEKGQLERRNVESQIGERAVKTSSEQAKAAVDRLSLIGQLAGGVRDQATYEAALGFLGASGIDVAKLGAPAQYDPAVVERFRTQAMTEKDRVEQAFKQMQQEEVARSNREREANTVRGQDLTAKTTMRGQNMTDARSREANNLTREAQATVYDPERGILVNKATGLARPAATMDGKPVGGKKPTEATQRVTDANDVLALLDQAAPLIENATGSYVGTGIDEAARAVGLSTRGAQSAAQLKALEGALISKMPKMSGPQSDKDVLLYKQMAGQIGDPTIPASTKRAAMKTIREINERASGTPGMPTAGPSTAPSGAAFSDPAKQKRYEEWKAKQR